MTEYLPLLIPIVVAYVVIWIGQQMADARQQKEDADRYAKLMYRARRSYGTNHRQKDLLTWLEDELRREMILSALQNTRNKEQAQRDFWIVQNALMKLERDAVTQSMN